MLRRLMILALFSCLLWHAPARAQNDQAAPLDALFGASLPADEDDAAALEDAASRGPVRDLIRERFHKRMEKTNGGPISTAEIGGLSIAYWLPPVVPGEGDTPKPLVIFSHGFHGCKTQSIFLMKALAEAGYIAIAPDHADSSCWSGAQGMDRPEKRFADYADWSDKTYASRATDIKNLYAALKADAVWSKRIDWDKVALAGHSLGGYTVLGLAGAWPSWKMEGIKGVLALSPYSLPFADHGDLGHLSVPVMYQGGTRDFGITPAVRKKGGVYDLTSAPAWYVEFISVGHFGWSDMVEEGHERIVAYSLWFLGHVLKGENRPLPKEAGVAETREK